MEVVEVGTNAKGTTRYRLVTPVEGWAFMAQSPITTKGAVLFKVEDGVGVVTFNQPENNNALSAAIFDFQAAQKMESEGRSADNSAGAQEFANRLKYVNECPVPVVALVAGPVFGGGVGICSVCDMVVCTERAAFQLSEDVKGLEEAAQKICDNFTLAAPHAVAASKALVFGVGGKEITPELVDYTAAQLASIRVKGEAVVGMKALLAKQKPDWAKEPLKVKL
ncbi:delta-3,5-delta-2,4-dienoyl-CoA isomerase [Aureococcus anophagefferens]|nr:delta-3,5-delta-2,4-dienoyl-CoA isomerase [Aureococcus anophagefferens]